ncbi:MAG: hypothetical protein IPP71_07000 [Bacteroidetes bacterium]|nr:hypothetical protein [Bacteroidota bacterium]
MQLNYWHVISHLVDIVSGEYKSGLLNEYLNQKTTMHYEMNKERYEKIGIVESDLY